MLDIRNLKVYFPIYQGLLKKEVGTVRAVDNVSFNIKKGGLFGLVGETASGKTTIAKTILGVVHPTSGEIRFKGEKISHLNDESRRKLTSKMQMIHQDTSSSLNPRKKVGELIKVALDIHRIGTAVERLDEVSRMLQYVQLPPENFLSKYPAALSGGQKQRVAIARALILKPEVVVLDEPTSALDVSVQAKILNLLTKLKKEFNLTYLFISHDLSVVLNMSDTIGVMYLGELVEVGGSEDILVNPMHPYTRALISAIPVISEKERNILPKVPPLRGEIGSAINPPTGCRFHTRCPYAKEKCARERPNWVQINEKHTVRCYLVQRF
ncbi:MAG TPA: ABC transporter ATP-binding protein [Thermoplasmata archaeon]|nr:ABC transporter ATP-binding protein [Thermoplasmata archaeon]